VNCHVDSSVVLCYLPGIDTELEKTVGFEAVGSSELLLIECPRVLHRYRLEKLLDDDALAHLLTVFRAIADGFHIIELTDGVKERAADRQMERCARAMGFAAKA
jgi:hypothetical protein